ncbi:hypothetical protein [Hyphobacterium sp.]|uniref:hypothetical protein n=1 Tax=Hyphobacterium sp. TaxID=2004662 RepID=UPI003B518359
MQIQKLFLATALPLVALASAGAYAQSGGSTSFSYHHSYYEGGYDRQNFRYFERACQPRSSGGLGLGAMLDVGPVLNVNVGLSGRFNECDERQYAHASGWSAEYRAPSYWENPRTGAKGAIQPRDYYRRGHQTCASFESESWSGYGDYDRGSFEMCRNSHGEWEFAGSYAHRR